MKNSNISTINIWPAKVKQSEIEWIGRQAPNRVLIECAIPPFPSIIIINIFYRYYVLCLDLC